MLHNDVECEDGLPPGSRTGRIVLPVEGGTPGVASRHNRGGTGKPENAG